MAPSWYEDLSTIEGISGSVGQILARVHSGPYEGEFAGRCTGVLVARNKLLTSAACMLDYEGEYGDFYNPEDLYVQFPQIVIFDGSDYVPAWFAVTEVWQSDGSWDDLVGSSSAFAVLTLPLDLGQPFVMQTAPVFLGDVEAALQDGTLLADDAVVAGFGETCPGCEDYFIRRLGKLGMPVEVLPNWVGGDPFLVSLVPFADDDPGAVLGTDRLDRGGPLFLREALTNRYVVVGTYLNTMLDTFDSVEFFREKRFTYLGRVGDTNPDYDHAELIRPHLGDFVDATPCTSDELHVGANSNLPAEMDLDRRVGGMEYVSDRCDPVPLMVHGPHLYGKYYGDSHTISIRPWLGRGAVTPEFSEQPVNRFCDCFDSLMRPIDRGECVEWQCLAGDIHGGGGKWKGMDLVYRGADGKDETIPADRPGPWVEVREGKFGAYESYDWNWTLDVPGNIRGTVDGDTVSTRGYLGAALQSVELTRSVRDDQWDHDLRGTVSFRQLEYTPDFVPFLPPPPVLPCLDFKACVSWVNRPADLDIDGAFGEIPWWQPGPPPHVFALDEVERFLLVDGAFTRDVTGLFGPLLTELQKMRSGGTAIRWFSAVESPHFLAASLIAERAIMMTPEGVAFSVFAGDGILDAVAAGGRGLSRSAGPLNAQTAAAALASMIATPGVTVDLPTNGRVLYSASEGAIYLVQGPSVGMGGEILRTDLESGLTATLPLGGTVPSGTILGATYVPENTTLYVLDTAEGRARLVSYDLAAGQDRVLWTVPFSGTSDFVSLAHTSTGELVMVSGVQDAYSAWLLKEKSNGVLAFLGRLDRTGTVVDDPAMGEYAPTLPVENLGGGLRYDSLDPREFSNGAPCEAL